MKQKNLKVNMVLSTISTLLSIIVPFITFPYFSRILLPEGLGIVGFLTSFVNYFYVFAVLGIGAYGIICCSKVRDNKELLSKTVSELFLINIVLTILSFSILAIVTIFVNRLNKNWLLLLIIAVASITTVLNLNWINQALEEYVFTTIRGMVTTITSVALLFIFVRNKNDLIWYVYINMGVSILGNIANFIYAKRFVNLNFRNGFNLKKHIKPLLTYFAITLSVSVFMDIDKIILGFMTGELGNYYVGIYEASSKINRILITLITGTVGVLSPRMSYLVSQNKMDEFHNMMKKSLTYVFLLALSAIIFISFFGGDVVILLLGQNYKDSIFPMQILLPIVLFKSMTNITNMYLMASNKEKHMAIALIIGAVINVTINVILIPKYNVLGVVIGTLVSEFFVMAYQMAIIRKFMLIVLKRINKLIILELLAITIPSMYLCFRYIKLNIYAKTAIAISIFIVELFAIMFFNKDEVLMHILKKIFRKNKSKIK